jgi:hypothetical protein
METLIELAFKYVPKVIDAIHALKKVPDAIATVQDLTAYVKDTVSHLKQNAPLNETQEVELDKWIAGLEDEDYWQTESAPGK